MSHRLLSLIATAAVVMGLGTGPAGASTGAAPATSPAPTTTPAPTTIPAPATRPAPDGRPAHHGDRLPAVYPTPQSMRRVGPDITLGRRAALIVGPGSDPDAVTALRALLTADGVTTIDTAGSTSSVPRGEVTFFVGGPTVTDGSGAALRGLGAADAASLAAEGYVLADGRTAGRPVVVLDGHDATGTFYAVQTLRQLIERRGGGYHIPGVRVQDWPATAVRGVIEGFYGPPWSNAQRASQIAFYGRNKMNTYIYSPKDDDYLRAKWREPYPPAQLAAIEQLVQDAQSNHVQFTYALSPGLSICYSSASDLQALIGKLQSMWDIGVRAFSIPFDDISYTQANCPADPARFGTGPAAAGAEQAYVLNEVQTRFIDTHAGAQPLQMVPTEYYDVSPSAYKSAIKADLSPKVIVGWTGVGVIAPTITAAQAEAAQAVYGHQILLWDNYPVNDYVTNRLLLGPYVGRSPDLTDHLYGITANPMIEPEASKIALFTAADYMWNSRQYDPDKAWQASLTTLAGTSSRAREALAAFADLEYQSDIDPAKAPVLSRKIAAFWTAWEAGDSAAAGALDRYLRVIQSASATLQADMDDPEFVSEAKPWLDTATDWATAARDAVSMLQDARRGDGAAAVAERGKATASMAAATASGAEVGDGVFDTFLATALSEFDRWLGLPGAHVTAITSMPTYESNVPANMIDGNPATYFWASRSPQPGDYVGVDLGAVEPVTSVAIRAADAASPNDYIDAGTLEYSTDGTHWTALHSYVNTPDITLTLSTPVQARYVRLRATQTDAYWVKVHEFSVTGPENQPLAVSGTPAPAAGSSLAAAADRNLGTAYDAGSSPAAGDAVTVTLPAARALSQVAVVGTGEAQVQVRSGGTWHTIGTLAASGYTDLATGGSSIDAIRLQWVAGSPAPHLTEVIPWYAASEDATLTASAPPAGTSVGQTVGLPVELSATQPFDVTGTLTASAPEGLQVSPRRRFVRVDRATQQGLTITGRATVAGTYPVTISFHPRRGRTVTTTITVTVHPRVGSTNVALASQGAVATASSIEDGLAQFAPTYANDGDLSTRWSSDHTDDQWLQIRFASPQNLGKIVIYWQTAYATAYELQTSTDGTHWTTADTVTDGQGGTETDWIDATGVTYLRMQGITRSTVYGYSIFELQAYPLAG